MIALIISGGQVDLEQLRQQIQSLRSQNGLLIAADSGLEALDQLIRQETQPGSEEGYVPDVAVGDFDSVDPQVLEHFQQRSHIQWERHRPEKNETDTELAFTIAKEAGVTDIILMGATGTRLDLGLGCQLLDRHNRIRLVSGRTVFIKSEESYPFVSFVPLTMEVKGVTLQGFKYPLVDHDLTLGQECGLCVSNELEEAEAVLDFVQGLLLVVEARD